MNIGIANLVLFIIAQGIGVGTLSQGQMIGLLPMIGSSLSGYLGLMELKK